MDSKSKTLASLLTIIVGLAFTASASAIPLGDRDGDGGPSADDTILLGALGATDCSWVERTKGHENGHISWDCLPIGVLLAFDFTTLDVGPLDADEGSSTGPIITLEEPRDPNGIPEPVTLALFGAGLAGLALARRRRRDG